MKIIPENSHWPRMLVFPLLSVALAGLLLARLQPELAYRLAYCPLRETMGIPCLTCGGTHSIVALMQGHLFESLVANPLVALGTIFFMAWSLVALIATMVPRLRRSLEVPSHEKRAIRIGMTLFLLTTWAWEFWRFH